MNKSKKRVPTRGSKQLGRKSKSTYVTKNGKEIKVNRSLSAKLKARKEEHAKRKAERLAGMPKHPVKRFFWRLHPKRQYKYWTSREGAMMALKVTGIGIIAGFLVMIGVFAYFRKDLPNLRDISGTNIGGSIRYYDKTGETLLWEDYDAVKRIPVQDENINQYVKDATIAIEDKEFFNHGGFDVRGITRAAFKNVVGGGDTRQGGSTITQQLVRLTQDGITREQTYTRKVKELILSIELERTYTKQEILTGYLNTAPYGNVQYGVEAAMRDYFHKSAKDITLDEAAFLAAIPKSPSLLSPYGPYFDSEALVGRQHYVLDLMAEQGKITTEERDKAKEVDTLAKVKPVQPKFEGIKAPWFVLTAKEALEVQFGAENVKRGGWKVITTLDLDLQKKAEDQVNQGMEQVRRQGGDVAAFVAEDVETGQVVALVGGSDFSNKEYGQNNYARYKLPPGSSFKPYDYLSLIEHSENAGAGTVLYDNKAPIEGYPCTNKNRPKNGGNCLWDYDFRFPGPVTLRYALGGSRNVPAVKAMLIAGIDRTIETANKLMGDTEDGYGCYADDELTKPAPCYASSAIGDGAYLQMDEHVHGYATISRNGNRLPMTYILKIEDAAGNTLTEWEKTNGEQVVRADSAYIVADMMEDPRASYMSRKSHRYYNGKGEWKFALKTGTTNDGKDGWMMGFSSKYAAGVWVGYHNRQRAFTGFMESMTQPIWEGWMQAAHENLEPKDRERPSGVKTAEAYIIRHHVGLSSVEPSPEQDLYPSWYEKSGRDGGDNQVIDVVSNKLATECTPERAKKTVDNARANQFSIDKFVDGGSSSNTEETDDVHACSDVKPSVRLVVNDNGGNSFTFSADVTRGTHPLSSSQFPGTVTFSVDGQTIDGGTIGVSNSGVVSVNYTASGDGKKTVRAEIVDSVLYSSSDSASFTVKDSGGNGGNGNGNGNGNSMTLSAEEGPLQTTFTWSNNNGKVTIYRSSNDEILCGPTNNNSCSVSKSDAPEGTEVYAKDEDDNTAQATVSD